jgi:hypothetical protein
MIKNLQRRLILIPQKAEPKAKCHEPIFIAQSQERRRANIMTYFFAGHHLVPSTTVCLKGGLQRGSMNYYKYRQ